MAIIIGNGFSVFMSLSFVEDSSRLEAAPSILADTRSGKFLEKNSERSFIWHRVESGQIPGVPALAGLGVDQRGGLLEESAAGVDWRERIHISEIMGCRERGFDEKIISRESCRSP
jgi:hypothetical protein